MQQYACKSAESKGRLHPEKPCEFRDPFQRDRDRIIRSAAFRRLEYKTQVFMNYEGDHYRTRLTHSLEVAQIARTLSRNLGLNEDLAETLALAHDIGHPPFGHAGEYALDACMKNYGGFDHNAYTLKILTQLESHYPKFKGLNLTWEVLEGTVKHNGPIKNPHKTIIEFNKIYDLHLDEYPSLEAQIASFADDIAYNNHDIEDGIRAKYFKLEDLLELPIISNIINDLYKQYPEAEDKSILYQLNNHLINQMILDLTDTVKSNINTNNIQNIEDIRNLDKSLVNFSPKMDEAVKQIKAFLFEKMYRHYKVNIMNLKATKIITNLFDVYINNINCLPPKWFRLIDEKNDVSIAENVTDFIAGMTDRYAQTEYHNLVSFKSNL